MLLLLKKLFLMCPFNTPSFKRLSTSFSLTSFVFRYFPFTWILIHYKTASAFQKNCCFVGSCHQIGTWKLLLSNFSSPHIRSYRSVTCRTILKMQWYVLVIFCRKNCVLSIDHYQKSLCLSVFLCWDKKTHLPIL